MNIPRRIALVMAFLLVSPPLWAGFLGHSVGLTFEYLPLAVDPSPVITDFGTATVGSGTEFVGASDYDVDVSDGSVRFLYSSDFGTGFWFSGYSGFRLRDVDGTLPNIIGVSIGLDSHIGIDPSRISFDSDNILVDLSGLSIDSGTRLIWSDWCVDAPGICMVAPMFVRIFQPELVLNVVFADVPEPATAAMVGIALLALAKVRRRQGKRDQRV
jgi:hypothetical protein